MRIFSRIVHESESAAGRPLVRLAPRRLLTEPLLFPPDGRDVQHVVPADEAVAIFRLELAVHVLGAERERDTREDPEVSAVACAVARGSGRAPPHLLGLLHRDVHVTVEAGEHAAVVDA